MILCLAAWFALSHAAPDSPKVTLIAAGDVLLSRYVGRYLDHYGPSYALAKVQSLLKGADLVVANLECPITDSAPTSRKRFRFQVPKKHARALLGIDLFSLANNHTLDCGSQGLVDTEQALAGLGLASFGSGSDQDRAWEPRITTSKGLRIAFIGFCDFPQTGTFRVVASDADHRLARAVRSARARADIVVVFAHWGDEGTSAVTSRQRRLAREAALAGADLVLGSHPHVLQPIEWIRGPRRTCVVYSMGDFVFDAVEPAERESALFRFSLTLGGVESVHRIPVKITRARPVPIQPGSTKFATKFTGLSLFLGPRGKNQQ